MESFCVRGELYSVSYCPSVRSMDACGGSVVVWGCGSGIVAIMLALMVSGPSNAVSSVSVKMVCVETLVVCSEL